MVKIAGCIGLSIAGMALANVAVAQETNVTTLAKSARLGGEFRSELIYNDHGFEKIGNADPDATSTIEVTTARLKLDGSINADTEYAFRFNLWNPHLTGGPLDYGYGTHWFNKMFGFTFGKAKVLQGGFDNIESTFKAHAVGFYYDNLVFADYEPMIAVNVNVGGKLSLQLLNDKVGLADARGLSGWNKTAHPTWVLGWTGEFGGISPLIDFGSYDNNKSRWIDVGVKANMSGLLATLDFYNTNAVWKVPQVADPKKNDEVTDAATSITLYVAYEVKNVVIPWLYFSTYDNKQADDSKHGLKDAEYNANPSEVPDPATGGVTTTLAGDRSDNGVVMGVGVDFANFGKGWWPFVAIVNTTAKFEDVKKPGESESRSEMQLKIGVLGEI